MAREVKTSGGSSFSPMTIRLITATLQPIAVEVNLCIGYKIVDWIRDRKC
jgi:hypothetical protein